MKALRRKLKLVGVFAHVLLFVTINSTIGQKISNPDASARKEIFSKCVRAIETENPDSIKKYFHEFRKYSIPSSGDTSFKNLPGLYYKAGKIMAAKNYKKETVEFYYEASLLYRSYYGEGNSASPIALVEIADYLFENKEYENAIAYYQSAIEKGQKYSDEHWKDCVNQIGSCYSRLGETKTAREFYQQVQKKLASSAFTDSIKTVQNYINIATTFEVEKDLSAALYYNNLALSYIDVSVPYGRLDLAFIYNGIGNVYLGMKEYEKAKNHYQKSLTIRQDISKPTSIGIAQSYYNIGYCYYHLDEANIALNYCDSSITANIVDYNDSMETKQFCNAVCLSKEDLLLSLLDKAEYLLYMVQSNQGLQKYNLSEAFSALFTAEEIFYNYYSEISSYRSKIVWSKYNERLYKLYVKYYGRSKSKDPILDYNLISYGDLKRNFNHRNFESLNFSGAKKDEFSKISMTAPTGALTNVLFYDTITYPLNKTKLGKAAINNIQNKLPPKTSIVGYSLADSNIYIQLISCDTIIVISKASSNLKETVSKHINSIKTFSNYKKSGQILYQTLWEEVQPFLMGKKEVIIIPDEFLFNLPFETIQNPITGNLLLETIDVSYSFSLNSLLKKSLHGENKTNYYGFSPVGNKSFERSQVSELKENFILNMADKEILSCSNICTKNGDNSIKFYAEHASILNLQSINDPLGICHISTHGIVDPKNPWKSYLQMYPDSLFLSGRLLIPVIYSLNVQAQLIILNACETGYGESNTIEGSLSLGRAFSANRINHLILSLWNIEDQVAYELIEDFFKPLIRDGQISKTLNRTKRNSLNGSLNHAFFWAGHVHYYNSL